MRPAIDFIKEHSSLYRTNPKAFDKLFTNIRFGTAEKDGLKGQTFRDIIVISDCVSDNKELALIILHEVLHRANDRRSWGIFPKALYSPGKMRSGQAEDDVMRHGRNHAWIYIQTAKFSYEVRNVDSPFLINDRFQFADIYSYNLENNALGNLDTDPNYLNGAANKFHKWGYSILGIQ